jgi:hypothetical protein
MSDYDWPSICTDPADELYGSLSCQRFRVAITMYRLQAAIYLALGVPFYIELLSRGLVKVGRWILPK